MTQEQRFFPDHVDIPHMGRKCKERPFLSLLGAINHSDINTENMKRRKAEDVLQENVAKYLAYVFPDVMFNSDLSGAWMKGMIKKKAGRLRSSNKWPDMVIYKPMKHPDTGLVWSGLFLELKAEGTSLVTKRNGQKRPAGSWKDEHIQGQAEMLQELINQGYMASFGIGYDHATLLAKYYLWGDFDQLARFLVKTETEFLWFEQRFPDEFRKAKGHEWHTSQATIEASDWPQQ